MSLAAWRQVCGSLLRSPQSKGLETASERPPKCCQSPLHLHVLPEGRRSSAIQVVDVPAAVHPVGTKVPAQLWIGVAHVSRAADVRREAGGIPGDRLGVGWRLRCTTRLLRDVALHDALLRSGLITEFGRTGRRWVVGAQSTCSAHAFAGIDPYRGAG